MLNSPDYHLDEEDDLDCPACKHDEVRFYNISAAVIVWLTMILIFVASFVAWRSL